MKDSQILIIGGGGHAKVAIAAAEAAGMGIGGIFDDDPAKRGARLIGYSVTGPIPAAEQLRQEDRPVLIAIGDNRVRQRLAASLPVRWASIMHPRAWQHVSAKIGEGTLVCAGAMIQPDAVIGAHSIINTAAVIEHDCRIGAFSHVASTASLAGGVEIGEACFIGAGAVILPGVKLGTGVTVGAGAVVNRDVADGLTVVGVPAKVLA